MEEKQRKRDQGGCILENGLWRSSHGVEIIMEKQWRINCSGGALSEISWRRYHGGEIMGERSYGGDILEK